MHPTSEDGPPQRQPRLLPFTATVAALTLPWLCTYSAPPSSTFANQALAWAAWALMILLLPRMRRDPPATVRLPSAAAAVWPALVILAVTALAAAASAAFHGLPGSLAGSAIAICAGAAVVLLAGGAFASSGRLDDAMPVLLLPLVIAGALSAPIAAVQIFAPDWAGNAMIGPSSFVGRASANLRQPNHLSSLALWAIVGVVWLREAQRLRGRSAWLLAIALVATVVLTGSRTGVLGIVVLLAWALVDRTLTAPARRLLIALPLVYGIGWWLFKQWGARSLGSADAVDRIVSGADISSARFAIWSNTLDLIGRHPLGGVGFGEFNLAWTLTPFPGRPTQFYDHTHNLALQWLVELGIPIGLLLIGLVLLTLWRCLRAGLQRAPAPRRAHRSLLVLIVLILLHSQLEYPLWYAYFLLPTMFAIGLCLGGDRAARAAPTVPAPSPSHRMLLDGAAAAMLIATALAVGDYRRVAVIFAPPSDAAPLASRIDDGKDSVLFAHHAHYAQATLAEAPSQVMVAFDSASHFLLDTRLMLAWARAWHESGDERRARHLADRLREFGNPASQPFLARCEAAADRQPWQCQPLDPPLDWRDFR